MLSLGYWNETWVNGNAYDVLKCWKENHLWIYLRQSMKEEGRQHVHSWENICFAKEEAAIADKLFA